MKQRVQTTLGDLIVAVTDEMQEMTENQTPTNEAVSLILNQLFRQGKCRFEHRGTLKFSHR